MIKYLPIVAIAALLTSCGGKVEQKQDPNAFQVPVDYYKLPNGLKVVLSKDATALLFVLQSIITLVSVSNHKTVRASLIFLNT